MIHIYLPLYNVVVWTCWYSKFLVNQVLYPIASFFFGAFRDIGNVFLFELAAEQRQHICKSVFKIIWV